MTIENNVGVMREIFRAIEQRDSDARRMDARQIRLFHPDVEFHWPSFLPYGGVSRGLDRKGPTWASTWNQFQPTEAERRMDPRVVAATDSEVVILWRQRGVSPSGGHLDTEVLGLYELHDGKLTRAQMFYFDPTTVTLFLEDARSIAGGKAR
jgi:ketosteroid isomerase-like protein